MKKVRFLLLATISIFLVTGCGKNEYLGHSHPRVWSVEKLHSKPRRSKDGGEGSVRGRPVPSMVSLMAGPAHRLPGCRDPLTTLSIQESCLDATRLPLCCLHEPR